MEFVHDLGWLIDSIYVPAKSFILFLFGFLSEFALPLLGLFAILTALALLAEWDGNRMTRKIRERFQRRDEPGEGS